MRQPGAHNVDSRQVICRDLAVLVLIGLCSLLPYLGQVQDLASREIRHAEIAREIAASGQFLVPTLLGEVYIDKPAILHSVTALCYRLAGEHSLWLARLPSVLCAITGAPSRALCHACGVLIAGVGVAVATVSKGPLGLLLPLLFAMIAAYRHAGLRRVPLAQWGLFVVALLASVSVWLVPAWLQDGGHYITQVLTQPDLDPNSEI